MERRHCEPERSEGKAIQRPHTPALDRFVTALLAMTPVSPIYVPGTSNIRLSCPAKAGHSAFTRIAMILVKIADSGDYWIIRFRG
jgi:hypothetical protein